MAKSTKDIQILGSDKDFLRLGKMPVFASFNDPVRIVDLFCGCGGITLGCVLAAHDLGRNVEIPLAVDFDAAAVDCYKANFPQADARCTDITTMLESDWQAKLTRAEVGLRKGVGRVDILVGGPPCQGHSDLNNYTRRRDPKNQLMQFMARAAVVFKPQSVIVENVVGSLRDSAGIVHSVESIFRELGYRVNIGILDFAALGVPQRRRRMIMIATKGAEVRVEEIQLKYSIAEKTVEWAIKDIADKPRDLLVDRVAVPQSQTKNRIDFLFDNQLYELPNEQRPACHRDKSHSYDTVYGRLRWDRLAQTITSGFYCMCMGRYVHPEQRRTLTAHEAARLQFFPDFFDFSPAKSRTKLAEIIGNAVPPKGAYAVARSIISTLEPTP
ncbi:MAG: DNA cytosine methyltransferase [Thiocapsa sp. C3-sup]|uniref:DNA cytosine methyltransferase n=1 Tax=unclassified Thiocapsa TaxID=2641286 RepID=UPI0035B3B7FE